MYAAIASGGTAEPVAFLNNWTLDFSTDKPEATAFEDDNKVYVAGLPDAAGTYAGFYDDATAQLYTAATDGVARKFYLYPNINTAQYFFGTALFDTSYSGSTTDPVATSGSWNAASKVQKVG